MAWGGCVGMAGMPYPPINTSAPTDADVCADRCRCLRRPMRMSAPTDADVCVDRCEPCREDFLALASGKAERSTSLTTLLVLPYRNNQQCIIPKKAVRHSCHTAFYIYKYRLNGNVGVIFLQGQGEPSILYYLSYMFLCVNSTNVMYFLQQENLMRFHNLALSLLKPNK